MTRNCFFISLRARSGVPLLRIRISQSNDIVQFVAVLRAGPVKAPNGSVSLWITARRPTGFDNQCDFSHYARSRLAVNPLSRAACSIQHAPYESGVATHVGVKQAGLYSIRCYDVNTARQLPGTQHYTRRSPYSYLLQGEVSHLSYFWLVQNEGRK